MRNKSLYRRDLELWEKATKEAKEMNRSLSNFIELVLAFYFSYRKVVEK